MEPKYFEEQIFFATLKIVATDESGGAPILGTGFIVRHPIPQTQDKSVFVLVTCRHVLFEGKGQVTLIFNLREGEGSKKAKLGKKLQIGPANYHGAYYPHDDPEVDMAAINISGIIDKYPMIFFRYLDESNWGDFDNEKLVPTMDVTFVGYPDGLSDQMNNLPIARAGKIASHPRIDFNGKPEYLIDAQVFPGSSGSPVFVRLDNVAWFCGLVGKSHFRRIPVETIQASTRQVVKDFLGLGVVYKPAAVLEVVKKVAAADR